MANKLYNIKSLILKITLSCIMTFFLMIISINFFAQNAGEWTWMNGVNSMNYIGNYGIIGVESSTNKPAGLYEACEWTDNLGNFWLYGGEKINGCSDNLWKYNVTTNMWTWIKGSGNVSNQLPVYGLKGIPNSTNSPGERMTTQTWTDNNGNLWLFGGLSYLGTGTLAPYNDLWKYDLSTNMWTWMKGDSITYSIANYGIKGIEATTNKPPSTSESNLTWSDNQNNLWLLDLNGCLWKYKISTNNWIWMKGDTNGIPVFGVKGIPNVNNSPGSLTTSFTKWKDSNENFWLLYSGGGGTNYSVLFKYEISSNMWTWISGDTMSYNSAPDYSDSLCDYNKDLIPFMRAEGRACWTDNCDNLWLMGGFGCDFSWCGDLNDLIYFDTHSSKWIWAGNDTTFYSPSIYGTIGVSSPLNKPAGRAGALPFKDLNGDLWVYGGLNDSTYHFFGDLWKFKMNEGCPPCVNPYFGINENESYKNEITIYPNPFDKNTTIQFNQIHNNATLLIYNSFGQIIKEINNISGQKITISRDNISEGLYFVSISENGLIQTSKILITNE